MSRATLPSALAGAAWLVMASGVALSVLGPSRTAMAAGVAAAYAGFCGAVVAHHRQRRARVAALAGSGDCVTLVVYASQTGFAEQLALQTATALQGAGMPVQLLSLAELDGRRLQACRQALFVVSTTGEGDAPDSASGFARRLLAGADGLHRLRYGILALGDSSYARFCAFGHALEGWLQRQRAQPLFDLVEVDNGDAGALRHWQNHLSALSGGAEIADWERPRYDHWRLARRHHLNPGSQGAPAYHLVLAPPDGTAPDWQAGDIAEVGPCHAPAEVGRLLAQLGLDGAIPVRCDGADTTLAAALATRIALPATHLAALRGVAPQQLVDALAPLPHREYSIASLPRDGQLELLVRQARHDDGRLGLASGWLTEHAAVGSRIALRIRANRSFHAPAHERPLILVGNGTGLAGLRAQLKARAEAGRRRNWLLFGERSARHDAFFAEELAGWRADGTLARVDHAWSRDGGAPRYVQDALRLQADGVRQWVADGAAIYVCGSLQGMAGGVHDALAGILGEDALRRLADDGRYRRDVY
ncbi:Putative sulfite reductase (NADPH) flavoprotein alpha-component [Cupriavidus taiwanensis]|uniref:NADPH--hemoprotein reductase n=1 Tax=Cupriavidus taiwanensis TaxID=164546 RepID=A0A975XGV3_9BURK|nr:sulfite reductase subunit alpha [Cupriavidus taiwanensis]SOY69492.1 Putative sulfite reductase (NADPH) flavoprotein alpha-component [Cupriavidus taiwanensis]